jgi:glucan 1,3-beta-glucosidase
MASRPDSFAEAPLDTPDTPLKNNNLPWPEAPCHSFEPTYTPVNSSSLLFPAKDKGNADSFEEKASSPRSNKRAGYVRPVLLFLSISLVAVAVVLPVYFLVIKPQHKDGTNQGAANGRAPPSSGSSGGGSTWGGNGSTVTTSDGSTFTYINPFGGYCECCSGRVLKRVALFVFLCTPLTCVSMITGVDDPNDPFDNSASPNSWTPPLNESWVWGKNKING